MNSIPLSAPDGTVYAYACGECQLVSLGFRSSREARAEASKETADACCLCLDCRVVKVITFHPLCDACFQKRRDAEAAAQLKRVEKALNPEAALELLEEMESYCRDSYGNDWLEDVEFNLHASVEAVLSSGRESHLYRCHGTQVRMDDLRTAAGGWWTRQDGDDEPRFVTTAEWLEILTATQRRDGETT